MQRRETTFAGNSRKVGEKIWHLTDVNFQTALLGLLISSQYFCTDESSGAHITPKLAGMQVRTQLAATICVYAFHLIRSPEVSSLVGRKHS
jgi:hypothetical protein